METVIIHALDQYFSAILLSILWGIARVITLAGIIILAFTFIPKAIVLLVKIIFTVIAGIAFLVYLMVIGIRNKYYKRKDKNA